MSERALELTRRADGVVVAAYDDRHPAEPVVSWEQIRRLRVRHRLADHWAPGLRAEFEAEHGHPFADWWAGLTPGCRETLMRDPSGPVPPAYAEEIRKSLRSEPGRDGLRVDGSYFTDEVQDFLRAQAATMTG